MKRFAILMVLCAGAGSCNPHLPTGPDLSVPWEFIDAPTSDLSETGKALMNGVYQAVEGKNVLGDPVVGKWVGNRWCLYSQHDVVFSECAGGASGQSLGDSIKLFGYIRNVRSGSGTRVRLNISTNEGAREIISGVAPPSLTIKGVTDKKKTIELRRVRGIFSSPFEVLAHRGGGRNSDRLGVSENSIPMIRYAAILGATAVEIDVKRTRDNKLIVFHDDTFSPRTVQGAYLLGRVENFDLEQIKLLGKLIYGEQIPTLTEALTAVIDETGLSLVWLDVKDPGAVSQIVQIQKEMRAYAATKGRESVSIVMGIPSQEVLNAYLPFKDSSDALVELEAETALALPRCRVWAPIWTREITAGEIAAMHAAGKRVFSWTVDLRETIEDYLKRIDGILSNYPTLVTALHDSRE